ncbi:MAG: RsmB/NOP family class I SAM-dependent RNA methyltransferase [Verrucomicrobia bacterium]|nr:RsmB/NOP family class I SAM-dependent RNA methyltransferase [Verrucomicrobiota bacterium]
MHEQVLKVAAAVVARADRGHPADAVLRDTVRAQRGPSREFAAEISRAVFAYYRWLGWLERARPLADQIARALELDERFRQQPRSFPDAELISRSVPAWLSEQMRVTAAWARALQTEPALWLRARPGTGPTLARKLGSSRLASEVLRGTGASALSGRRVPGPPDVARAAGSRLRDALRYEGGEDLFRTPEFHAGEFEIQDLSSQAVSWLCDPQPGETWWDVCAGEGGKTLHLADLMQNKGLIWATDRAAWRLQHLKRRAARAKVFNYRGALWDGGPRLPTKTKFDGVLVDAPCSGLGTWQRNPHARWTTTLADVRELAEVQKKLLAHVAGLVKPGGRLIYAVCTLTRAETDEVADAFEKQCPEFSPLTLADPLGPSAATPRLWLWPQDCGGNGMFVAAWQQRERKEAAVAGRPVD